MRLIGKDKPVARSIFRPQVITAAVLVAAVLFVPFVSWLHGFRVPAIVRGSIAGGGYWGACQDARFPHLPAQEAISPDFNARLAKRFPPGSPEDTLIDTLKMQGFGATIACDSDRSIKESVFRLNGNEVMASAFWKVDGNGKIVWTKGFVAYTFL